MSLQQWETNGWLRKHHTSPQEINNLLQIVERDTIDAGNSEVSADWQFGIAYNAALKLCTIALYAEGYRPEKNLAHYRTLLALPLILGVHHKDNAIYLDACRAKRNTVEYDSVCGVSQLEAEELLNFIDELKAEVLKFLKDKHPKLLSKK